MESENSSHNSCVPLGQSTLTSTTLHTLPGQLKVIAKLLTLCFYSRIQQQRQQEKNVTGYCHVSGLAGWTKMG